MMTCRKCLHAPVCFDREGCTKYYGPEIAANNVEKLCIHFVDRSRYVVREKGEWVAGERCNHKPCRIKNPEKWVIYKCSVCGYSNGRKRNDFCPNCGADMRKGENDG